MTETTQKTPLKWFYFLIYFAFIFGPIINVISGITNVMGFIYTIDTSYGGNAEAIYNALPALQPLDIVYGLCLITLAVCQFVVRSALAKKKATGPAMLNNFFVASAVISCLRTVVFMVIVGMYGALDQTRTTSCLVEMASSVVVAVIMVVAHNVYFAKRKHVFAN